MSAELDFVEKNLRIANLQADTALKQRQHRLKPWKLVMPAMIVGGVVGAAVVGCFAAALHFTR